MRKVLLVATVVAACSSPPADRAGPSPVTAPVKAAPVDSATLFTPSVTGVVRSSGSEFPVIEYVSSLLPNPPPCWTALRAAVTAALQLEVPGPSSYFVIEGALPQDQVERCVTTAFADAIPVHVSHDGELAAFEAGPAGTAYAAWRGSSIVIGSKAQVVAALAANVPDVARTWRERMATLPPAQFAMWRGDALLATLFGVATTSYVLAFNKEVGAGKPFGRVIATYGRAEDATEAARRMSNGELEPDLGAPREVVEAFKRMRVRPTGTTVEVEFDLDMFAGVDLPLMQQWLGGLAARVVPAGSGSAAMAP